MINRNNIEYNLKPLNRTLIKIKRYFVEGRENEQIKTYVSKFEEKSRKRRADL